MCKTGSCGELMLQRDDMGGSSCWASILSCFGFQNKHRHTPTVVDNNNNIIFHGQDYLGRCALHSLVELPIVQIAPSSIYMVHEELNSAMSSPLKPW